MRGIKPALHSNIARRFFLGGSDAPIIASDDNEALARLWKEKRGEGEPKALFIRRGGLQAEDGKQRSSRNAARPVPVAEMINPRFGNPKGNKTFEQIAVDCNARITIERELVLDLAGLLSGLHQVTSIETGPTPNKGEIQAEPKQSSGIQPTSRGRALPRRDAPALRLNNGRRSHDYGFLRLANFLNGAFDRLSRCGTFCRQLTHTIMTRERLRSPQTVPHHARVQYHRPIAPIAPPENRTPEALRRRVLVVRQQ